MRHFVDFRDMTLPKAETDIPKLTVETVDNHLYFYANVDGDRVLALIRQLRELDSMLLRERLVRGIDNYPPTPIWLHMQSPGGDLFDGLAAIDQIKAIRTPVWSIVEGMCASAATLLSMACSRRFISPNGYMLIHQFWSFFWGTHEEFKDEMKLQKMLIKQLISFYALHSKTPAKQLEEMLKRDTWMNAKQAVAGGFADQVLDNVSCPPGRESYR